MALMTSTIGRPAAGGGQQRKASPTLQPQTQQQAAATPGAVMTRDNPVMPGQGQQQSMLSATQTPQTSGAIMQQQQSEAIRNRLKL